MLSTHLDRVELNNASINTRGLKEGFDVRNPSGDNDHKGVRQTY